MHKSKVSASTSVELKMDKLSIPPLMPIERPRCPQCQVRMRLAQSEPLKDGFEKRVFECGKCKTIETKMVADPLKSDAVARLANELMPPSSR
jgi:tRNA(Ile2) C34 agmatinyltransferase TiaS